MPKLDHGVEDNEHGLGFGYGKVGSSKTQSQVECMMARKTMSDMDYGRVQSNNDEGRSYVIHMRSIL